MRQLEVPYRLVAGVKGDVVECGVALCDSLVVLAGLMAEELGCRALHGFDAWQNDTAIWDKRMAYLDGEPHYIPSAKFSMAQAALRAKLDHLGLTGVYGRIALHRGWLEDTLPVQLPSRIAFAFLDVDTYASYRTALCYIWPALSQHGVVVFDEYQSLKWWGCAKAVDEFRTAHEDALLEEGGGRWWLRKR